MDLHEIQVFFQRQSQRYDLHVKPKGNSDPGFSLPLAITHQWQPW